MDDVSLRSQWQRLVAGSYVDTTSRISVPFQSHRFSAQEDFLRQWLEDLVLHIPQASFLVRGLNVTIRNLECTKFKIDSIATSKPAGVKYALFANAAGFGASCDAEWSYKAAFLHGSGTVHAAIGGDSSLSGPLQLILDSDPVAPLPKQILTSDCRGTLTVTELHFGGASVLDWILKALQGVIQNLLSRIPPLLCKKLDQAIEELKLDERSAKLRQRALAPPTPVEPLPVPSGGDIISWRTSRFFAAVEKTVNQAFGKVSGPSGINSIMANILRSPDGNVPLVTGGKGEPHPLPIHVPQLGTCELRVPDLSVSGLTSFRTLLLKSGQDDLSMNFLMALGHLNIAGKAVLTCSPASPHTGGPPLTETFNFSAAISNVSATVLGDLAIRENQLTDRLLAFPRRCIPGAVGGARLRQLQLSAMPGSVVLEAASGDSLEQDVDRLINTAVEVALTALGPSVRTLTSGLIQGEGRDMMNGKLAGLGHATPCPPGPPPDEYAFYTASDAAGVMSIVFTLPLMLLCFKWLLDRGKSKAQQRSLALSAQPGSEALQPASGGSRLATDSDTVETRCQGFFVPPWDCLASHPAVGARASVAVPLLLAAVGCLFLCSNLNVGVKVGIALALGDEEFRLPGVFDFSLVSSIIDMWSAGSYALAILIGFFSGCWPYLKLLLMAFCWYQKPEKLPLQQRKMMLEFLDAYGKWSLVDSYVLVMFMVSFQIRVSSTSPPIEAMIGKVGTLFDFSVLVHPEMGFYYFLLATILSLVAGHIVTAYNRRADEHDQCNGAAGATEEPKQQMCKMANVSTLSALLVPMALFASLVVVLAGSAVDSFQFDFSGLAWVALGEEGSHRPYSLIALGQQLPEASGEPHSFGIHCIQVVFFLFSLVVIIAYHCLLILLWLCPFTCKTQRRLLAFCQVLQAWSGIDVFVVSIIASVAEISRLVTFIVGDKCDAVDKFLRDPPAAIAYRLPRNLLEHPTCVDLDTELKPGCWCLFAGALVSTVVGQAVISRMQKALRSQSQGLDAEAAAS